MKNDEVEICDGEKCTYKFLFFFRKLRRAIYRSIFFVISSMDGIIQKLTCTILLFHNYAKKKIAYKINNKYKKGNNNKYRYI